MMNKFCLFIFPPIHPAIFCPSIHPLKLALRASPRPWRIVLLKVTYYATSGARDFAELCHNSQFMLLIREIVLTE